jgi:hypothetical protein
MGFFDFFKKGNKDNEVTADEAIGKAKAEEQASPETEAEEMISESSEGTVSADTSEADAHELDAPETDETEVNAEASPAESENMQEGLQDTSAPETPEEAAPNAPVKFTPEQLAERKAQQEELTKKRDSEGMVLSYLIQRHHEIKTVDSFKSALDSLTNCWLWVPMRMQMSKNDAAALQEAQKTRQKYAPKDPVRLVPALIRTKDGELVYSSFTNRDEIPKEMTKQFIWVQVPSGKCAQTVVASPQISSMIINPNSKSLLLKKELLEKLVKPVSKPDEQAAKDLASEPDTTGYTS